MKKSLVIHPFLFALFPILSSFSYNIDQLLLNAIFMPTVLVICFALLLWFLLSFALKDRIKGGLLVSLFLLVFFSYGHFFSLILDSKLGGFEIGRHIYFLPVYSILFTVGTYFIIRTRRELHNLTTILNIIAVSLVIIPAINIVGYQFKRGVASQDFRSTVNVEVDRDRIDLGKTDTLPDIYYIIFDRYASSSTLREFFNYDNTEFTSYLIEKGFYVAFESRANYPKTFLSLSSSLNMEYLDYLRDKGEESNDQTIVYAMLQDYKVWRFLKSRGYKFIHFGSSYWEPTRINKYADMNYNYLAINTDEFSRKLFETTMFYPFFKEYFLGDHEIRKTLLYQFDKLAELPNIKEPKFVFAHMLIPHEPYVFGRNGEPLTRREVKEKSEKENYLNYLIFTNKKIKQLVDKLLSKSNPPPIIILQSDEGPFISEEFKGEAGGKIDWRHLSQESLRIHMKIFNAYYLPGPGKNVLYESISPVNTFRVIFNLYFGTNYKLLNDESYIFEDTNHPYKFINVTNKLKYN